MHDWEHPVVVASTMTDHDHHVRAESRESVGNHSLGVSACEDDYDGGYCSCSKCRALDKGVNTSSGRLSDRYASFWNSVYAAMKVHGHGEQWVSGYA